MAGTLSMDEFHQYLEKWLPTPKHMRTGTFKPQKDVKKEPGVAPRDFTMVDLTKEDLTEPDKVEEELVKSTAALADFRILVTKDSKGKTVRKVIRPDTKEAKKSNVKGKGKGPKESSGGNPFRSKEKEEKEQK